MKRLMHHLFKRHSAVAWGVLAVSLALVLLTCHVLYLQAKRTREQQFNLYAQDVSAAIAERMRQHEQILLGGAGLFDASGSVSRAEWHTYISRLQLESNYPGIQGVGFSQIIAPSALASHTRAVQAEGFPRYSVRPPGRRALYSSIIYLEPFRDRNLAAFGFDMMSEPSRAAAMRSAGESGLTTISAKVTLVQETQGKTQAGFLMYVPVYQKQQPLTNAQERWRALQGFVYSPFRVDDLMQGLLGESIMPLDFMIYDGQTQTREALLHDSAAHERTAARQTKQAPQFMALQPLQVYGRTWTIRFMSRPAIEANWFSRLNRVILATGSGFSLLLFAFVSFVNSRRAHAEALAQERTLEIRSQAESLRRSQQMLDTIVEHIPAEVFVKRASDLRYEFLNHAWERNHKCSRQELIGKTDYEFYPKEQADRIREADKNTLQTEGVYEIPENRIRSSDGRERILQTMKIALRNAHGEVSQLLGISIDITEQKAIQLALQESAQQTQAILDNAADGIITIDEKGLVQSFNKASERIFGYAAQEVIGRNVSMLMPEPYHSEHDGYLANYRQSGVPRIIGKGREVEGRRKDGSTFPMDLAVSLSANLGQPLFIGLVRDITERKRIEQMKSEFVSTVSHELRTPLTSINGALGLVCGGALGAMSAQAKSMLDIAYKNSQRLTHLINDLLDMEKLTAGKMKFDLQVQALMPLVEQALESTQTYAQQHQVKLVITERADDVQVRVDASRLQQVLSNFLSNAAKFSPPGAEVAVVVRQGEGVVRVEVIDHGPGIPDEFRGRIFQKFSQADSSDTRQKGGTGLGLAITKELVERMNGLVGFSSQPGQGANFHFELPVAMKQWAAPLAPGVTGDGATRVLVVEDEPDIARLMVLMLERAGYSADVAGTGEAAMQLLAQRRYAAVTMDLLLPDQSGVALIRKLRSLEEYEKLPVIVVSAFVDDGKLAINGDFAAVDWLQKPIDEARLVAAVRRSVAGLPQGRRKVLHVEDDRDLQYIVTALGGDVAEFDAATTLAQARERLAQTRYELVILDIGLPDGSGWSLLPEINALQPAPRVIVLSGQELDADQQGHVHLALVKSRTSIENLLVTIKQAIANPAFNPGESET